MSHVTRNRPWLALLGWFPPFYVIGLLRNWGKSWCTTGFNFLVFDVPSPHPVFWWPTKLYQKRKYETRNHFGGRR